MLSQQVKVAQTQQNHPKNNRKLITASILGLALLLFKFFCASAAAKGEASLRRERFREGLSALSTIVVRWLNRADCEVGKLSNTVISMGKAQLYKSVTMIVTRTFMC